MLFCVRRKIVDIRVGLLAADNRYWSAILAETHYSAVGTKDTHPFVASRGYPKTAQRGLLTFVNHHIVLCTINDGGMKILRPLPLRSQEEFGLKRGTHTRCL